MVNLWRNAIRALSDEGKATQHPLAKEILQAIRKEWERRHHAPDNPEDKFHWPSTEAPAGSGYLHTEDWIKEGVFQFLGYKVGNIEGEPQAIRERILAEVFTGPIPPVFPKQYIAQWGRPSSVARLQKMAETIASLTRNAKRRRDHRMYEAIQDWEVDLEFLYHEYYMGKFRFAWPATAI